MYLMLLYNMEKIQKALFFVILSAVLLDQSKGQTMVGNCNLAAFSQGGMKCQRNMMMAMKYNNTNCSTAYSQETACLNAHVDSCVQGNYLNIFRDSISKLLLLLVYHCGDLGYQVSDINSLLLESSDVQCNANELTNIVTCWDDFRVTFQANRSDPALCRKYAEGKQNCTDLARQACSGICDFIAKDEYNPFCANHTDPPDTSELYDCIVTLGCPIQVVFGEAKKCDLETYLTDFAKDSMDCSTEHNKFMDCLRKNLMGKCPAIQKSGLVSQDVLRALDSIPSTKRLFCGSVLALNADSLHRSVKELANCRPEYFTSAEKCAEPFRKTYSEASTKKSPDVCSAFLVAKRCLNKAIQDNCAFNEATVSAVMFDNENPFCEGGKDPQTAGANSRNAKAATVLPIIFSIALSFNVQISQV